MKRWKIWYSDGSTFCDQDGKPEDAPKTGAVIIVVEDGRFKRRKLALEDYYLWSPTLKMWTMQKDAAGVILRSIKEPYVVIVAGDYMLEEDFERILIEADNDDYIKPQKADPPHTAWRDISGR